MPTIRRTTIVDADIDTMWKHSTSIKGVNRELWPVHMSHPRGLTVLPEVEPDDPRLGRPIFTSRVTLFRVIPIDLHRLTLASVDRPHGFSERSTSLAMRRWNHDRTLTPHRNGGTVVADVVVYRHRIPGMGLLLRPIFGFVFTRRHRKLVRLFGRRT